jgi:hypothetical protein
MNTRKENITHIANSDGTLTLSNQQRYKQTDELA